MQHLKAGVCSLLAAVQDTHLCAAGSITMQHVFTVPAVHMWCLV
jgi:hypothetical protein